MCEDKLVACTAYISRGELLYLYSEAIGRGARIRVHPAYVKSLDGREASALRNLWEQYIEQFAHYSKISISVPEQYFYAGS